MTEGIARLIEAAEAFADARKQREDARVKSGPYSLSDDDDAVDAARKELASVFEDTVREVAKEIVEDSLDSEFRRGDYDPDL